MRRKVYTLNHLTDFINDTDTCVNESLHTELTDFITGFRQKRALRKIVGEKGTQQFPLSPVDRALLLRVAWPLQIRLRSY